jgi:hypothetical protein
VHLLEMPDGFVARLVRPLENGQEGVERKPRAVIEGVSPRSLYPVITLKVALLADFVAERRF